jgi:predicted transcriptional regulator
MNQLTVNYSIKISENQHKTLIRLRQKYRINPAYFIRSAISEKLKRENLELKERITKKYCPF